MFHWYEVDGKICSIVLYYPWVVCLTAVTCCIVFFQTHLTFGKEFTEAVEMKQVAQQEAERARFVVEKVLLTLHVIPVL